MFGSAIPTKLRLKIDLPAQIQSFAVKAVDQVNNQNPALFDTVTLRGHTLSVSAIDCDLFLRELRTTEISHLEWQRTKQLVISELQVLQSKPESESATLFDCLQDCSRLAFSDLPASSETEDLNRQARQSERMTLKP